MALTTAHAFLQLAGTDAQQFAELRARNALPEPHDLWISVSALQRKVPVVTRNTAQFEKIRGLRVVDY